MSGAVSLPKLEDATPPPRKATATATKEELAAEFERVREEAALRLPSLALKSSSGGSCSGESALHKPRRRRDFDGQFEFRRTLIHPPAYSAECKASPWNRRGRRVMGVDRRGSGGSSSSSSISATEQKCGEENAKEGEAEKRGMSMPQARDAAFNAVSSIILEGHRRAVLHYCCPTMQPSPSGQSTSNLLPKKLVKEISRGNLCLKNIPIPVEASEERLETARKDSLDLDDVKGALATEDLLATLEDCGLLQDEGDYEVETAAQLGSKPVILGMGRYASVEAATFIETGERVAIKRFRYLRESPPCSLLEAMRQEVRALGKVSGCKEILRIVGGWVSPRPSLVFELAEGGSLHAFMRCDEKWLPIAENQRLTFARDVAAALAYMHDAGIIHRDVKAHNVMMVRSGDDAGGVGCCWKARLGDLGSAIELDSSGSACGEVGSTGWAAPEIFSPLGYGKPCDIFSFGILTWEVLTCGKQSNPLCAKDLDEYVSFLEDEMCVKYFLQSKESGELNNVIRACLNIEPRARPTAGALLARINSLIEERNKE